MYFICVRNSDNLASFSIRISFNMVLRWWDASYIEMAKMWSLPNTELAGNQPYLLTLIWSTKQVAISLCVTFKVSVILSTLQVSSVFQN